jgi:Fic family protein
MATRQLWFVTIYPFDDRNRRIARSVNRNKYVNRADCSPSTALRDLQDLVSKGVLVQLSGEGRNTRYGLTLKTKTNV